MVLRNQLNFYAGFVKPTLYTVQPVLYLIAFGLLAATKTLFKRNEKAYKRKDKEENRKVQKVADTNSSLLMLRYKRENQILFVTPTIISGLEGK